MRVVVTGATGNVGTSVIEALGDSPRVDEAVGLARRRPTWEPPKTSWVEADILDADLEGVFAGADADAFEHLEIGSYELLLRVAERAGDGATVEVVKRTLAEERDAAAKIAASWDRPGVALGVVA